MWGVCGPAATGGLTAQTAPSEKVLSPQGSGEKSFKVYNSNESNDSLLLKNSVLKSMKTLLSKIKVAFKRGEIFYGHELEDSIIVILPIFYKFNYRFNTTPTQAGNLMESDKLVLKFTWKCKGPRTANAILRKNHRAGRQVSPMLRLRKCGSSVWTELPEETVQKQTWKSILYLMCDNAMLWCVGKGLPFP